MGFSEGYLIIYLKFFKKIFFDRGINIEFVYNIT